MRILGDGVSSIMRECGRLAISDRSVILANIPVGTGGSFVSTIATLSPKAITSRVKCETGLND